MRRRMKAIAAAAAIIAPVVAMATPSSAQAYRPYDHLVLQGSGWSEFGRDMTVYENELPAEWTIGANINAESVRWTVEGPEQYELNENARPYYVTRNSPAFWDPANWGPGTYEVSAVGYSQDNQRGTASAPQTMTLTILAGDNPKFDFVANSIDDGPDQNPGDGECAAIIDGLPHCTLRAAVEESNALPGVQTVGLRNGDGPFGLDQPLKITDHIGLFGNGSTAPTISPSFETDSSSQLIEIATSNAGNSLTLFNNVSITNGRNDSGDGGNIRIIGSVVWFNNSSISHGSARRGGGIFIEDANGVPSVVSLVGTQVRSNYASEGGGIFSINSTLHIETSQVDGNTASVGGGVHATSSELIVLNSLIADNTSRSGGSGIHTEQSQGSIDYSTIANNNVAKSSNSLAQFNAGLHLDNPWKFQISSSVIEGNTLTIGTSSTTQPADCAVTDGTGIVLGAGNFVGDVVDGCQLNAGSARPVTSADAIAVYSRQPTGGTYFVPANSALRGLGSDSSVRCPGIDVYGNQRAGRGECTAGAVAFVEGLSVANVSDTGTDQAPTLPSLPSLPSLPELDTGAIALPSGIGDNPAPGISITLGIPSAIPR